MDREDNRVMKTIHRDIASALIFSKDGKLLMGMKDPKSGGVDPGESQLAALRREVLEETGIDISNAKVNLADDKGIGETEKTLKDTGQKVLCKMKFYVYRADLDKNASDIVTHPNDDLVKLERFDTTRLNEHKLTPPSTELFKRLGLL